MEGVRGPFYQILTIFTKDIFYSMVHHDITLIWFVHSRKNEPLGYFPMSLHFTEFLYKM
jgi:hypothetical protein